MNNFININGERGMSPREIEHRYPLSLHPTIVKTVKSTAVAIGLIAGLQGCGDDYGENGVLSECRYARRYSEEEAECMRNETHSRKGENVIKGLGMLVGLMVSAFALSQSNIPEIIRAAKTRRRHDQTQETSDMARRNVLLNEEITRLRSEKNFDEKNEQYKRKYGQDIES